MDRNCMGVCFLFHAILGQKFPFGNGRQGN